MLVDLCAFASVQAIPVDVSCFEVSIILLKGPVEYTMQQLLQPFVE